MEVGRLITRSGLQNVVSCGCAGSTCVPLGLLFVKIALVLLCLIKFEMRVIVFAQLTEGVLKFNTTLGQMIMMNNESIRVLKPDK